MGNGTGVDLCPFQLVSGLSLQEQDEAIAQAFDPIMLQQGKTFINLR